MTYNEGVWKYARLTTEQYLDADFIVSYPRPGSYLQELIPRSQEIGGKVIKRISEAISSAFDKTLADTEDEVLDQLGPDAVNRRIAQINSGVLTPGEYSKEIVQKSKLIKRVYGDRSILKEIDQALSMIRHKNSGESSFELQLNNHATEKYLFNRFTSEQFHRIISTRELGEPFIYNGSLRSLDNGGKSKRKSGKFINSSNKKEFLIHVYHDDHFSKLAHYLSTKESFSFIGCPLIEYGAFDPTSGDVFVIEV